MEINGNNPLIGLKSNVQQLDGTQQSVRTGKRDGDPNTEFSYRIVGKRLGYEDHRLERAPWTDNDPNLSQWSGGIR